MRDHLLVFSGSSNRARAEDICRYLDVKLGNGACSRGNSVNLQFAGKLLQHFATDSQPVNLIVQN